MLAAAENSGGVVLKFWALALVAFLEWSCVGFGNGMRKLVGVGG